MKYIVILGDGMADEPIEALGGKTPIEYAKTPEMDRLAPLSELGMAKTIPEGMSPGSDTANLSVMGYDPKIYYSGRSPLEALSIGIPMKDTDIAIRCNIVTISEDDVPFEEKTIIVLFGDHQPKIASELTQDEWLKTQKVPYMLWANFDIEEKNGEDMSTNYLSTLIYEYSGMETTNYVEFLKDFKEEIPVFTSKGYKGKDGKTYELDDESPYKKMIDEYKILQYYYMFDNNIVQ